MMSKNLCENFTILDLFSGIGGFSLALKPCAKTIAYAEINPHAREIIEKQMNEKFLERAPLFEDVRKISSKTFREKTQYNTVNIITAGFPCQDISVMNLKGLGLDGERSKLGYEVIRIGDELKVPILFFENSPQILHKGLSFFTQKLNEKGYDHAFDIFSAGQLGAPHLRKRFYMIAFRNDKKTKQILSEMSRNLMNAKDIVSEAWQNPPYTWWDQKKRKVVRKTYEREKDLKRRTFLLGNSIVPLTARYAFEVLANQILKKKRGFVNVSKPASIFKYPFVMDVPYRYFIPNKDLDYPVRLIRPNLSTPLASRWSACKIGSTRACDILQNQILYDKKLFTSREKQKDDDIHERYIVNPAFLEWMMGYPVGYTY